MSAASGLSVSNYARVTRDQSLHSPSVPSKVAGSHVHLSSASGLNISLSSGATSSGPLGDTDWLYLVAMWLWSEMFAASFFQCSAK